MIAILVPVCSRNQRYTTLEDTPLWTRLLPSLQKTATLPYQLYIGYDDDDAFYSQHRTELQTIGTVVELKGCQHAPAKAWNRLAAIAQNGPHEYFFQIGDDVVLETPGWDQAFIQTLEKHRNVGVTGPCNPINHAQRMKARKPAVIENAFVHRTHLELFGYLFHPTISNWYCDDWLSRVYDPWCSYLDTRYTCANTILDCRYQIQGCPNLTQLIREGQERVASNNH